jgi:hypothetical protein
MFEKFTALFVQVVALITPYLTALGTTKDDNGTEWPESAPIAWAQRGVESLAAYVARELNCTVGMAEHLILLVAQVYPENFRVRYMQVKGGGMREDANGNPVPTISLRLAGKAAPFVPGQTTFGPRRVASATPASSNGCL